MVTVQFVEVPARIELGEHETERMAVVLPGLLTVTGLLSCPVDPLLSVAVTVIVKVPVEPYECASEVAVPDIPVSVVPSPQLTVKEASVPSGSVPENVRVTVWPVVAGLGTTLEIVTVGDLS